VVLLVPSDVPYLNAEALMAAQTMKSIGMNVDAQSMDWASIGARRAKRDAPDAGGWNMYVTVAGEFDANSPISNAYLGAACGNTLPGWPCDKPLDELRTAWLKETVPAKRKELLDAFQARAYEAVPYINAGQYSAAFAARANIKGLDKLWAGMPTVWMLGARPLRHLRRPASTPANPARAPPWATSFDAFSPPCRSWRWWPWWCSC
jgi:peptide/nickel transport system substrate-binding protein